MFIKSDIPFSLVKIVEKIRGQGYALTGRYPLFSPSSNLNPFFIVGCGRSGNTLLRAMLVASNDLVIPPESYVLPRVIRKFIALRYLPWETLASVVISEFEAFKEFHTWNLGLGPVHSKARSLKGDDRTLANIIDLIYQEYSLKFTQKPIRWGDKTPKNAEFLEHICSTFPKAQYIHLIRDPRSVFLSYKKSKHQKNDLITEPLSIVKFWNNCHKHIQRCKVTQGNDQFIVLHYENLIRYPETELQRITQFLGIEFKDKMLDFWKNDTLGDVDKYSHHAGVLNPINSDNLDKWKDELSVPDILLIERYCMPLYNKLCEEHSIVLSS